MVGSLIDVLAVSNCSVALRVVFLRSHQTVITFICKYCSTRAQLPASSLQGCVFETHQDSRVVTSGPEEPSEVWIWVRVYVNETTSWFRLTFEAHFTMRARFEIVSIILQGKKAVFPFVDHGCQACYTSVA